MTTAAKTIISLILSVAVGVGGYFGARQIITGGEIGPPDKTKYTPVNFKWDKTGSGSGDNSDFLAGKYVRGDGRAALYIDYDDYEGYFVFELYVMPAEGKEEYQTEGHAQIYGSTAYGNNVYFESTNQGVIELEAYLYDNYAPADGTYTIAKAKYGKTPKPKPSPNPSPNPNLNGGGGGGGGGTNVSPSPGGGGKDQPPGGGGGGGTNVSPSPGGGDKDQPPGGGGGGGGTNVSPSPGGGGKDQPPGGGGGTNSTPQDAFRAAILMMQEQNYSNREISSIYTRSEYDAAVRYYSDGDDSIMTSLYDMRNEFADDTAAEWASDFGLDYQTTQRFVQDLFNAMINWLKAFEYTVDSVEYLSDDSACVHITVTNRVEFDVESFMNYTLMETFYAYCDFTTMTEQEIVNWLINLFVDYMVNPGKYGDIKQPYTSHTIYTVRRPDSGWVVDNYANDFTDLIFRFEGEFWQW